MNGLINPGEFLNVLQVYQIGIQCVYNEFFSWKRVYRVGGRSDGMLINIRTVTRSGMVYL